jgi:hypothetical protein
MSSPIRPERTATNQLPPVSRVLSPEEFDQAEGMTPAQIQAQPFPVVPQQPSATPSQATVGAPSPDLTQQAYSAGQQVWHFLSHPAESVMGVAKGIQSAFEEAFTAPVIGTTANMGTTSASERIAIERQLGHELPKVTADTPGAVTPEQSIKGTVNTLANAGFAIAPELNFAARSAVNAALGAYNDSEQPFRGALTGLALGETLHQTVRGAGAVVDRVRGTDAPVAHDVPVIDRRSPLVQTIISQADRTKDALQLAFAPDARGPEAAATANIIRATTGEQAAAYERASFQLDQFRRGINGLSDTDKLGFIDAVEGGRSQPQAEFQPLAETIRTLLDDARTQVQNLGTGKLEHFIENYFPHIWTDPERAALAFGEDMPGADLSPSEASAANVDGSPDVALSDGTMVDPSVATDPASPEALNQARARAGTKRPMQGSRAFLKQRTIPTTAEGMALGLQPVSLNPIDLTLLKLREMQRYVMAHQTFQQMQEAGLAKFVRAGDAPPDGYTRIDDKIATVYGPRQGMVTLPDEANVAPEQVGVIGQRVLGEYYAPESGAKVLNNYLSPGLRGNAIFDAFRGLGNSLNQAQLGLSAFHLGFTSFDAATSRIALGLEYLASGEPIEGLTKIVTAPLAPVTNALKGKRIRAAYLDPESASPDMQALANAVQEAGGRVRQDSFYKNSAPQRMMDAWKAGNPGKAAAMALPAVMEASSHLLMEHIVPMQKLGVFGDLAQKVLADLPPDASLSVRRAALADAWDSVDNRMGQLVYDNLFWNKTFKDLAMVGTRSLGWNIGTVRELGGGIRDIGQAAADLSDTGNATLTHKAAYVMALPIMTAMVGAAYQYLRTGTGPQELKDYFYPQTGEVDADGNPERVQMPSYMKDVVAYQQHPVETVGHKVHPFAAMMLDMLQNEDYYGDQIRNPNDPLVTQVQQEGEYLAKSILPFSIQNLTETSQRGDQSTATKAGAFFGVTPAPRTAVRTEAQNKMADYLATRRMTGSTPEDAEARNNRAEILAGLRGAKGVDLQAAVSRAIEHEQLTPRNVIDLLRRAGSTPAQEKFKRLTLPQALDVFRVSTPAEKRKFVDALVKKMERAQQ